MLYLIHRGWGGRYTNYVSQNVKGISRMRRMELTPNEPVNGGYRVVVCADGAPLTESKLKSILDRPRVSFYVGDSKGVPQALLEQADEVVSVSTLKVCHQLEAAILTATIENALINANATSCV